MSKLISSETVVGYCQLKKGREWLSYAATMWTVRETTIHSMGAILPITIPVIHAKIRRFPISPARVAFKNFCSLTANLICLTHDDVVNVTGVTFTWCGVTRTWGGVGKMRTCGPTYAWTSG